MRGVPGSGKSTVARTIAGENGKIHSTDEYFYENDTYRFDHTKLKEYHNKNFSKFCSSLIDGVSTVVCDNTNIAKWQYQRYVSEAKKYGYIVAIIAMPHPEPKVAAKRNIHGVPQHVIKKMIMDWEN